MPVFVWEGTTQGGDERTGKMEADSREEVQKRLRQQQINPSSIQEKSKEFDISIPLVGGVPTKSIVVFTRQFATMIDAGLPLVQCLELLGGAEPHAKFKEIIQQVKDDIEAGSTLADALSKHPEAFDDLYVSLVEAGEVGGILDTILQRLAVQLEKSMKLKRKVRGAFTYPVAVLFIAFGVVTVLLYKVIPTFKKMFENMGDGELPQATQIVVGLSSFVQNWILVLIGAFFGLIILAVAIYRYPPTRELVDRALLKAPLFGDLVRKTAVARFTRTLGTMVSSGVPIVDSLEIVSRTAGNKQVEKAIMYTREQISQGQNMVDPLQETGVFPDLVVQMIGVGESTGALDTMLGKIADFYEDEVDVAVDNLTSMIEPLLMVFLGLVVGGLLIAMYLPIFTMAGQIQQK
ncbi:MAG: type II secretion system F family protein [Bradymonadaceae bacterium]